MGTISFWYLSFNLDMTVSPMKPSLLVYALIASLAGPSFPAISEELIGDFGGLIAVRADQGHI